MAIVTTVIDPVTRIEGHMKVQVDIEQVNGVWQVIEARCTGTQFRGFESILLNRDPRDAPYLTQRICGVCPVSHGLAASMALEAAFGLQIPANARIMRNLVLASNFISSHILHFYLLAALDYVNGPPGAPWNSAWAVDPARATQLQAITNRIPRAADMRRKAHEMGALFGGRLPMPPAYQAGGFTASPTSTNVSQFRTQLAALKAFIDTEYVPDAELLARVYPEYTSIGEGPRNLLAFGVFDEVAGGATKLLRRGLVKAAAPTSVQAVTTANITESVGYSWYASTTDNRNPRTGSTVTVDPASKPGAYSWLKAPRYQAAPFECGPLARMWVNGDYRVGVSVMDRHVARAKEAQKIANAMGTWLNQLAVGQPVYNTWTTPTSGTGEGLTEAPRGALGHWVTVTNRKLSSYQVITPTCWNASPLDTAGVTGPMEHALLGVRVADPEKPLEVLRVIHSYDPCLSCAVHVMRPGAEPVVLRTAATA